VVAGATLAVAMGASAAAPPPHLERVRCLTRCGAPDVVTAGGRVALIGTDLQNVTQVSFHGDPGPVSVAPLAASASRVKAKVPTGALTGHPSVSDVEAQTSVSPQRLHVVSADRVPKPRSFDLHGSSVDPRHAFFDARRQVRLRYRFQSDRGLDVKVQVVRRSSGDVVRSWVEHDSSPFAHHARTWNGLTDKGHAAPDGRYQFRVGRRGKRTYRAGSFTLHGHIYPVRGPHWYRGPIGDFGAPRSGGRTHEGFDIMAACGTRLDAARGGRVVKRGYDPQLYGNFVLIDGRKTPVSYFYAHLRHPASVGKGDRVHTAERIGEVGKTGNARTVGCHLHFEMHLHGHPFDPEPDVRKWDRWS
jgi:murein DD-endopeptidase MepM/ murein hydrolase activator NlpD